MASNCPPGKFLVDEACAWCYDGFYNDKIGQTECQICLTEGYLSNINHTKCVPEAECTNSSYNGRIASVVLVTHEKPVMIKQCVCPFGTVPDQMGNGCKPCEANKMPDPQNLECIDEKECITRYNGTKIIEYNDLKQCGCADGQFYSPQGFFWSEKNCEWCFGSNMRTVEQVQVNCFPCDPGLIAGVGFTDCITEATCTGIYSGKKLEMDGFGSFCICEDKVIDKSTDNPKCVKCPGENEIPNFMGSVCLCRPGYGIIDPMASSCQRCPAGTYNNEYIEGDYLNVSVSKSMCTPCPAGQAANITQTSCVAKQECGKNAEAVDNQCRCKSGHGLVNKMCTPCDDWFIGPGADNICRKCQDSSNEEANGDRSACICKAGFYRDRNNVCTPCEEGYYKEHAGDRPCTRCAGYDEEKPENSTEVPNDTRTACVCASGYGAVGGQCMICSEGYAHAKNTTETSKQECTKCDAETEVSNLVNGLRTACICANGFGFQDGFCSQCDNGTYNSVSLDETAMVPCRPCRSGFVSNADRTGCEVAIVDYSSQKLTAIIVGCVLGLLVVVLIIVVVIVVVRKRFCKTRSQTSADGTNYYNDIMQKNLAASKKHIYNQIHVQQNIQRTQIFNSGASSKSKTYSVSKKGRQQPRKRKVALIDSTRRFD